MAHTSQGNGLKMLGKIEPLPLDNLKGRDGERLAEDLEEDPSAHPQKYG